VEQEKPKKKKINYSKRQETAIRDGCKRDPDTICERLWDSLGGKMNLKQPSDFIAYRYPYIFYIEAKTTAEIKLPMSNISEFQFNSLTERSKVKGAICGIIVEYRLSEDQIRAFFVEIDHLNKIKHRQGKKYLDIEEASQNGIEIETHKKKVNFSYDMKKFFNNFI
jgi:recombination protein U